MSHSILLSVPSYRTVLFFSSICPNFRQLFKEMLNKSGLMRLQWKMNEFKAKIASHSTAMAQIFNAEILYFTRSVAKHGLFSIVLRGV